MKMNSELTMLKPMLALPSKPHERDSVLSSQAYIFDVKWDGTRALLSVHDGVVTIRTREGLDATARYPDLVAAAAGIGDVLLDGEIVVMDPSAGRFSFSAALSRNSQTVPHKIAAAARRMPATFMAFDLLWLNGRDLRSEPLNRRLAGLTAIELGGLQRSTTGTDGHAVWRAVEQFGLEGLIAKRWKSRYGAGTRGTDWVKVKRLHRLTAIVDDYVPGAGGRTNQVGALVLSLLDGDQKVKIGKVGTGFKRGDHAPLLTVLREGHEFLVEVEYMEATADRQLRQPSFKGVRTDITRADCTVAQIVRR